MASKNTSSSFGTSNVDPAVPTTLFNNITGRVYDKIMFIPAIDNVVLNKLGVDGKYGIYELSDCVHDYRINNLEDKFEIGDIRYLEFDFPAQEGSNNTSDSAGEFCDDECHSPSHLLLFPY